MNGKRFQLQQLLVLIAGMLCNDYHKRDSGGNGYKREGTQKEKGKEVSEHKEYLCMRVCTYVQICFKSQSARISERVVRREEREAGQGGEREELTCTRSFSAANPSP